MIETGYCHVGMSSSATWRRIIANGLIGGMKLQTVATMPLGDCVIGIYNIHGTIKCIITSVTNIFAARIPLTPLPTAPMP